MSAAAAAAAAAAAVAAAVASTAAVPLQYFADNIASVPIKRPDIAYSTRVSA
jgi:hypothetical protein